MIKGDRVGAVLSMSSNEVRLLGYGIYQGDKVPPAGLGWITDLLAELKCTNPCIQLDNGDIVWGCECWWGSEAVVRARIGDRKVVEVRISDAREAAKNEGNE
jgi:hypothetical protein